MSQPAAEGGAAQTTPALQLSQTLRPAICHGAGASGNRLLYEAACAPSFTGCRHHLIHPSRPLPRSAASARRRRAAVPWLAAANGAAAIAAAFGLAASFAWLVDMHLVDTATSGGGPPYYPSQPPPAAGLAAGANPYQAAAPAGAAGGLMSAGWGGASTPEQAAAGAAPGNDISVPCPPGCIDFGPWAALLKLPWHCMCLPGFVSQRLQGAVQDALRQLAASVAGGVLMVAGAAWLAMLSAAAYAGGEVAAAAGIYEAAVAAAAAGAGGGLDAAREPLLPNAAAGAAGGTPPGAV